MAVLLTAREISKQHGSRILFEGVSLAINDGEIHGLIGPNGAGKSTLMKVLAGLETPDSGEVALRKGVRMVYVAQDPAYAPGTTVGAVLEAAARERTQVPAILGQAGFTDPTQDVARLSGGWTKRLAIAEALLRQPDLLLLDEPTNHLDLEGIEWLEDLLSAAPFASIVVSHDRYFLENAASHMMELSRVYPGGILRVAGNYSTFVEKRGEFLVAQAKEREALATVVRREVAWLRRGAKARTRKSKARIGEANRLIENLGDLDERRSSSTAVIDFTGSDRRTKKLIELDRVSFAFGDLALFSSVKLVLSPGQRLGLAGPNGSGKTTLLKLLTGDLKPQGGEIRRAPALKTVYFEQARQQIDPALTLRSALVPEGDSVVYGGRTIHVIGWAKRFLFREEQLQQPVGSLSGGERARVHIARLMLEEADLLLLDEPTNDLDIPTLEVLEETLLEFPGALVLVTHDRALMDRVSNAVLGLDGEGGATIYADLAQWETDLDQKRREKSGRESERVQAQRQSTPAVKKKLSYIEQREYDAIEGKIHAADERLAAAQARLHAPDVVSDHIKIEAAYAELTAAQAEVDTLYARWAELEGQIEPPA
jgi:ABC transport system ATP-binding/permease protein